MKEKVSELPTAPNTPDAVLERVRRQLPLKQVFIVYETPEGEWMATYTDCSAADLCLAGSYMTHRAVAWAAGELDE